MQTEKQLSKDYTRSIQRMLKRIQLKDNLGMVRFI